jgi:predicted MFS family arabinose efflux permease
MGDELQQHHHSKAPRPVTFPITVVVSCTIAWVVAQLSYNALPQLLDPIKAEFDLSDEIVTRLYGYELFVFALVALGAAGPLSRLPRVRVALAGGAIAIAAGIVASLTDSYHVLVVCRVMLGAGGALVGASGTASASSSADPERLFAMMMIGSSVLLAAEPVLLESAALGPYGLDGGFLALAIATAVMMPLLIWLLPPVEGAATEDENAWSALFYAPNRGVALAAMLALFIYASGQGGVWTYLAELGERSEIERQSFGFVLSSVQLLGLVGSFLAIWLGDRFGFKWPIVLGVGVNVAAGVGLAMSKDPYLYVFLNVLWYAAYYFVVPYLLGLMAKLDELGRWAVAVDAMWWLGDAAGPPVAGFLVERGGIDILAAFPLTTGFVCIAILMRTFRFVRGDA